MAGVAWQKPMDYTSLRYALSNRRDTSHVRRALRLLAPTASMRLLEVGCGRGFLTQCFQEQGLDAVGIDANPHAIQQGVAPNLFVMRAEKLDFPDASFDLLCSFHAVEHVPPIEQALAEMARVVKPGGRLLICYPAELVKGLYAVPSAVILYGDPTKAAKVHCHRITPRRLQKMAAGLPLEHLRSEFHLLRSPQFYSLFRRMGG
jgi:SAM-dependent methyltransferase